MVELPETELNIEADGATSKLESVNSDSLDISSNRVIGALGGPCIKLYLPETADPIELWNVATVTLGRKGNNPRASKIPTIDLTGHHSKLLGVSRLHAEIFYRDGNYYVKDLQSTNGTWVNKRFLESDEECQLSAGDTLCLGHLMIQIGGC